MNKRPKTIYFSNGVVRNDITIRDQTFTNIRAVQQLDKTLSSNRYIIGTTVNPRRNETFNGGIVVGTSFVRDSLYKRGPFIKVLIPGGLLVNILLSELAFITQEYGINPGGIITCPLYFGRIDGGINTLIAEGSPHDNLIVEYTNHRAEIRRQLRENRITGLQPNHIYSTPGGQRKLFIGTIVDANDRNRHLWVTRWSNTLESFVRFLDTTSTFRYYELSGTLTSNVIADHGEAHLGNNFRFDNLMEGFKNCLKSEVQTHIQSRYSRTTFHNLHTYREFRWWYDLPQEITDIPQEWFHIIPNRQHLEDNLPR